MAVDGSGNLYAAIRYQGTTKLTQDGALIWRNGPVGEQLVVHPETTDLYTLSGMMLSRMSQTNRPPVVFGALSNLLINLGETADVDSEVDGFPRG